MITNSQTSYDNMVWGGDNIKTAGSLCSGTTPAEMFILFIIILVIIIITAGLTVFIMKRKNKDKQQ